MAWTLCIFVSPASHRVWCLAHGVCLVFPELGHCINQSGMHLTVNNKHFSWLKPEFLDLTTTDILDQIILCYGSLSLCFIRYIAASLASTY